MARPVPGGVSLPPTGCGPGLSKYFQNLFAETINLHCIIQGGWFRSCLHASTHRVLESHPRQWVDGSDPTYTRPRTGFFNPTHGSGWMVQIQPTRDHAPGSSIPPTAVGGLFRSNLLVAHT